MLIQDPRLTTLSKLTGHAHFHDSRVLEIGCGNGRVTRMYAGLPRRCVGVEPEAGKLFEARLAVPGAVFACASGMELPFGPGVFEVVLFTLSLHHHPEPGLALAEAARVCVPGGRVLALEPAPEGEIQRLCNIFVNEDADLARAKEAIARCGLRVASRDEFQTQWRFADFAAVADYAFSYYDHPPDTAKREAMRAFLGPRANDAPLVMTDTLRLACLRA